MGALRRLHPRRRRRDQHGRGRRRRPGAGSADHHRDAAPDGTGAGMTVVVTGAAGLLGSHVVAALAAGGRDIPGVDSAPDPAAADLPTGVEFVRADLRDPQAAIESLAGAETVVHA